MRCYIEPTEWDNEEAVLSAEEAHHAVHVLRAEPGTRISVFNGIGGTGTAEITHLSKKGSRVSIIERDQQSPPSPGIMLFQAVIREQKMDLVVQKGIELGVSAIAPVTTANGVVQLTGKKAGSRKERWAKIALGAAKQSGAIWLPEIAEPVALTLLLQNMEAYDLLLVCSLGEGSKMLSNVLQEKAIQAESIGVFVGPEGDFTEAELQKIEACGAIPVSLGSTVLRAETAALYVLSVLRYVLGR